MRRSSIPKSFFGAQVGMQGNSNCPLLWGCHCATCSVEIWQRKLSLVTNPNRAMKSVGAAVFPRRSSADRNAAIGRPCVWRSLEDEFATPVWLPASRAASRPGKASGSTEKSSTGSTKSGLNG